MFIGETVEKLELLCTAGGMQHGAAATESSVELPQKNTAQYSSNSTLGIYLEVWKSGSQRHISTPMFFAALSTTAKMLNQLKCPLMDKYIKKIWYIYTIEYYSAFKKKGIL